MQRFDSSSLSRLSRSALIALVASAAGLAASAPEIRAQGTLADYERAATVRDRIDGLTVNLVQSGPHWIEGSSDFWYRVTVPGGDRFVLIESATPTRRPAFDHARLATALSRLLGGSFTDITLPFDEFEFLDGRSAVRLESDGRWVRCALVDYTCADTDSPAADGEGRGEGRGEGGDGPGGRSDVVISPDGRWEAFIRDHNLAIRPAGSDDDDEIRMLSMDGSAGNYYQLGALEWSPDSRKIAAYREFPGYARQIPFIQSSPPDQLQPRLVMRNYTKPGDPRDFQQPMLFDVATGERIVIDTSSFPNAYSVSDPDWRDDSRAFTFEYNERGHQAYRVIEVDGEDGAVRVVIDETSPTFVSYRRSTPGRSDTGHIWRHDMQDGREILWMSERDGWNHIYLYDGETGRVKNQVTSGEWVVKYVDSVDVANRQMYFRAMGMNEGQDPYFIHHYRVDLDGTNLIAFTEGNGDHEIEWSPDRSVYVDTWSRVDMPPVVELRRGSDGALLMELERGDMSAALATGWTPPEVFVAKGRDGETDIWGIIVRPFTFDPERSYPVLENIYAGPQGSFVPKTWGGGQSYLDEAEVGFIVVRMDGMGTNNRSKAFHDVAYRDLADAGFPDRIAWHRAVAERYDWYDVDRVGLYGGSAGGQNAAGGVFLHGDFYSAAFASSGCHDNRMDKMWWNEQWMGWPIADHYEASSNVTHAHRLTGRLFLAVGEMDTNVDPASTMQVVDALVRAGKSFDLLVVPNGGHGATGRNGARKRIDFFVESLMGVVPPDWNRLEAEAESTGGPAPELEAALYRWPDEEAPPYGFFESEVDTASPYTWW
jgi:dipeptidyl aminopeptidase/acylaminoacyl peptidase